MIYDCFTFFNELDLLEIRLNILNDVVDKFVLVEMDKTHTGKDKPLYYQENKERFKKFHNKIIHIMVTKYPNIENSEQDAFGNRWLLENYQRDQIIEGLKEAKNNDIVLISDLDEIPNPKIISSYKNSGIWILKQKMMYYYLNNLCITNPVWKNGTRMGRFADLKNPNQTLPLQDFYRFSSYGKPTYFRFCHGKLVNNGGWHFSYCGGIDAIINKRKSIVEQQFNNQENMSPEYIHQQIEKGEDILGRKQFKYHPVFLDKTFPKYILENQGKYKNLIFPLSNKDKIKLLFKKISFFLYHKVEKENRQIVIRLLGFRFTIKNSKMK